MIVVDILLATYNGARYLEEQLASIEAQSYPHWRLIMRDDGSTDATALILERFQLRHAKSIILPSGDREGAIANFSALLKASTAPYVMCCDQDDLWDNDKVEFSLNSLKAVEEGLPPNFPLLLHTDLRLVDAFLNPIASSFWSYAGLEPEKSTSLNRLLVQNSVTGCALICNRPLLELALPIPSGVVMHDWWLALVASALGKLFSVPRTTIAYRQHGQNLLGAQRFGKWAHLCRAWKRKESLATAKRFQASLLLQRYHPRLQIEQQKLIEAYLSLHQCNVLTSRYLALRYGFLKQGALRQLASFLLLKQP